MRVCLASCFSHHFTVFLLNLLIVGDVFQSREEVEKLLQFAVFHQDLSNFPGMKWELLEEDRAL